MKMINARYLLAISDNLLKTKQYYLSTINSFKPVFASLFPSLSPTIS
uniref:Uncharacterized protein n=1 Tax=Parascaris equorum TaxID=6256 RepID=A0A914S0L5_PAREQ